jgi:hypothetical protein
LGGFYPDLHPEFRSTYDTTLLCMTDQGFYIPCKGAVVEFSFEGVKVPRGEQMRGECYFLFYLAF